MPFVMNIRKYSIQEYNLKILNKQKILPQIIDLGKIFVYVYLKYVFVLL